MPLADGESFAGYRILRRLGSGGMGEVYLAQHPRLPRRDALKILPAHISADPEFRARFQREAGLAATLWHPHIVRVHDSGEFEDKLWISMDYVDGADVSEYLKRNPSGLPTGAVIDIVSAIAGALDYAHKRGLLHRDIKPANILVGADDSGEQRILLTDFGIARRMDDTSRLTATNMTVGTLAYSSPEQLRGDPMDGRADQYSLAATAYLLFSGTMAFPQSSPGAVITGHLTTTPLPLSAHRAALARFDAVMARALAKNPAGRYPSCTAFTDALRAPLPTQRTSAPVQRSAASLQGRPTYRGPVASAQPPAVPKTYAAATSPTQGHNWIPAVVGVTALLIALAVVGTVALTRGDDSVTSQRSTRGGDTSTSTARSVEASSVQEGTTENTTMTTPTSASSSPTITIPGADEYGFLSYAGARCPAGDRAALIARTTLSVLVVCESSTAGYYYRGVRLKDNAGIQLTGARPTGDGFDVINGSDLTRYEIRSQGLTIVVDGEVAGDEPMIAFQRVL